METNTRSAMKHIVYGQMNAIEKSKIVVDMHADRKNILSREKSSRLSIKLLQVIKDCPSSVTF